MTFCIITHVPHGILNNNFFAYSPYVREMNIWLKYVDDAIIVAPMEEMKKSVIHLEYKHSNIQFISISDLNLLNIESVLKSIVKTPKICFQIYNAMKSADHIHLRCPGNIGLLGCLVQIFFPNKPKTAKYAGNWDPKAQQPWSYKLQKWILSNTFLTKNMKVLVYGEWENQTKNIKPFFTASYNEEDKIKLKSLDLKARIDFVFVGTLSIGKNPLYAVKLVEELFKNGFDVSLDLYGEGGERNAIENYIESNSLEKIVILRGNQNQEILKKAYQNAHFVLLASKSEGWPKAIAEGMFWGCIPLATKVSCVPFMLDYGKRGILLNMILDEDIQQLVTLLNNEISFVGKREKASDWSRKFTLNIFEKEIKEILK